MAGLLSLYLKRIGSTAMCRVPFPELQGHRINYYSYIMTWCPSATNITTSTSTT